ncbi:MAG TPA: hopanoid biosynthesis-associated RND transporter HpnN, partial [Stellaceae bacterium]|nr:hopanoid biosynthesis-associated RND transporter HpnN [Stellaceae bacterium]
MIARTVGASGRRHGLILLLGLALALWAAIWTTRHFAITTDTLALLPQNVPWRQAQARFDQLFPLQKDLIVVVIEGETPELAQSAAARLFTNLSERHDFFLSVRRPEGGPFFEKEGLLFLPLPSLERRMNALIEAEPLLGPLAADPSLRGVLKALSFALAQTEEAPPALLD